MGAGASIDDDSIRVAITIYEESRTTLKSNSEILVDLKTALGIPTPSLSLMPLAMAAISELAASHILSKSLLNNNHANSNSLVPAPNDTSMITEPPFDLSSMLPPPRISFEESHSTPVHSNKSKSKAFSSLHIEVQDHMDIMEEDEIDSVQLKNSKGAFNLNEQGILTPENAQLTHYNPSDFIEVKQIGKGASGSVFLSLHRPTMSLVAIKSIAINSDAKRAQVASELKILYSNLAQIPQLGDTLIMANSNSNSNSNSEEIVKFYDAYSTNNNTVNIIMEYCSGGTLQDLIDRGGSQNEIVLAAIAHSVAKGLLFLHHKNNIHRDIKPNNILLTTDGKVKLADFGISKELDSSKQFAQTFVGTFMYMSPEQVLGEKYNNKSDVYALGMVLLSVALGKYPIPITSPQNAYWEVLDSIQGDATVDLTKLLPSILFSETFVDFLNRCLQKDPNKRSSSYELMGHSLLTTINNKNENENENENKFDTSVTSARKAELVELGRLLHENNISFSQKEAESMDFLASQLGLEKSFVQSVLVDSHINIT